jgi:hypothetical protein
MEAGDSFGGRRVGELPACGAFHAAAVAGVLADADRFGEAVDAAQAAVDANPSRESRHARLIAVRMRATSPRRCASSSAIARRLAAALDLESTPRLQALMPD